MDCASLTVFCCDFDLVISVFVLIMLGCVALVVLGVLLVSQTGLFYVFVVCYLFLVCLWCFVYVY